MYNKEQLLLELEPHKARFEAKMREGQPPQWRANQRTIDLYCIGLFLIEKFEADTNLPEDRRHRLIWLFNRTVRAEDDPFIVAANVVETYISGKELALKEKEGVDIRLRMVRL